MTVHSCSVLLIRGWWCYTSPEVLQLLERKREPGVEERWLTGCYREQERIMGRGFAVGGQGNSRDGEEAIVIGRLFFTAGMWLC